MQTALKAAAAFCDREITPDAFLRCIYNDHRAKYIVRVVIRKTGVRQALADEVFQEAIHVLHKLLGKIDNPEGFYSFWYLIAWRAARTITRLYPIREVLDSQRDSEKDRREDRISAEEADERLLPLDEESATAAARSKFAQKLENDLLHREIVAMTTKKAKPKQPVGFATLNVKHKTLRDETVERKQRPDLTPEQQEFADIRLKLGLKIDAFAGVLDIPRDRLTSYLYGRANVPDTTLEHARQLLRANCNKEQYLEQITRAFAGWRDRLTLTKKDDRKLAKALGLDVERLSLIESGKEPVSPQQIAEFDEMVSRVEAFIS